MRLNYFIKQTKLRRPVALLFLVVMYFEIFILYYYCYYCCNFALKYYVMFNNNK